MSKPVSSHYDATAAEYHEQYQRENLTASEDYPANYFRLQILVNSLIKHGGKRVLEVGVGEGTPLVTVVKAGLDDAWGFDISKPMVEKAKANFAAHGLDPAKIFWGDVQDSVTYSHAVKGGAFDSVVAMGVMPHVQNDDLVIGNIAAILKPGGQAFIEFRNKIFSLFTFNRLTLEFIRDDLLAGVAADVKDAVVAQISPRLALDMPPVRPYDAILAKFHNPFEMETLFTRNGFENVKFHWYHYHPALPMMEKPLGQRFREEGFKLEHDASGWRGMFLCSAYCVEATRKP